MNKLIVATIPLAWVRADCLGFYPTVFGIEGDWVNSDIQFALQVRNDIVNFGPFQGGEDDIEDDISMYLYTHFFASEGQTKEENQVLGSMLYVDEKSGSKVFSDPSILTKDDPFSIKRLEAQYHGHKF